MQITHDILTTQQQFALGTGLCALLCSLSPNYQASFWISIAMNACLWINQQSLYVTQVTQVLIPFMNVIHATIQNLISNEILFGTVIFTCAIFVVVSYKLKSSALLCLAQLFTMVCLTSVPAIHFLLIVMAGAALLNRNKLATVLNMSILGVIISDYLLAIVLEKPLDPHIILHCIGKGLLNSLFIQLTSFSFVADTVDKTLWITVLTINVLYIIQLVNPSNEHYIGSKKTWYEIINACNTSQNCSSQYETAFVNLGICIVGGTMLFRSMHKLVGGILFVGLFIACVGVFMAIVSSPLQSMCYTIEFISMVIVGFAVFFVVLDSFYSAKILKATSNGSDVQTKISQNEVQMKTVQQSEREKLEWSLHHKIHEAENAKALFMKYKTLTFREEAVARGTVPYNLETERQAKEAAEKAKSTAKKCEEAENAWKKKLSEINQIKSLLRAIA